MRSLSEPSQRVLAACTAEPKRLSQIQSLLLDMDAVRVQKIVGVLVNNGYLVNCAPKTLKGLNPTRQGEYALAPQKVQRIREIREPVLTTNTFALYDVWR